MKPSPEEMRRTYMECSEGPGNLPNTVILPCKHCGGVVTLSTDDDGVTYAQCDGCFTPTVELITDNPKYLGRISSD